MMQNTPMNRVVAAEHGYGQTRGRKRADVKGRSEYVTA
jgi:hypothetical protein